MKTFFNARTDEALVPCWYLLHTLLIPCWYLVGTLLVPWKIIFPHTVDLVDTLLVPNQAAIQRGGVDPEKAPDLDAPAH